MEQRKWAAIAGRWALESHPLRYLGPQKSQHHPHGICLTEIGLSDGRVTAQVRISDIHGEGRLLFGYRTSTERYLLAGIGGWECAYTIGESDPTVGWRALATAGSKENLIPEQSYRIEAILTGQRVELKVDGIRVLSHVLDKPLAGDQVGLFAWGNKPVEFDGFDATPLRGKVFVVMQFSEPYQQLYNQVVKEVASKHELDAYHVGEVFGPGLILKDITQGIIDARIVVAEITPINQNVFYELGFAHAIEKPTILLAERGKALPFDISGHRVLFYDNTIAGKQQVEEGLSKHFEAILRSGS